MRPFVNTVALSQRGGVVSRDLYAAVSTRIIAELEAGAAPWVRPWSVTAGANTPCNAVSNRPYSGCNVVLLWMAANAGYRTPRYLTFKQARELGGNVRKGEHGTKVYFVKQLQVVAVSCCSSPSSWIIGCTHVTKRRPARAIDRLRLRRQARTERSGVNQTASKTTIGG